MRSKRSSKMKTSVLALLTHLIAVIISIEANVIQQHRAPWSSQHLQKVGKALLEKGEIVASFLDGIELTSTIPQGETNKRLAIYILCALRLFLPAVLNSP